MSQASGGRTVKRSKVRCVLVVAGDEELLGVCRFAASVGAAAVVETCEVADLTNSVATWQPVAIVMPESVNGFDRAEFDALARDVRGRVVALPEPLPSNASLREWLVDRLREAADYRAARPSEPPS